MISNKFFDIDYEQAYPKPTPERIAQAFFNRMWRKLHVENFSYLIVLYGLHRVGKSLCAVSIAHILDETFEENLESRVVYNSKDLLKAFKELKDKKIKGGAIIPDESGSGDLSSQRWYEDMAKLVSANLQAIGHLNPLVLFVSQNLSFLNSTARKLSSGVFEVTRNSNRYSTIKPFWIYSSPWISKSYRKYPVFCEDRNGISSNVYKVNRIRINMPPLEIRKRYVDHSQDYKNKFLLESQQEIELMENIKTQKTVLVSGINEMAEEVLKNIGDYSRTDSGGKVIVNAELVRHEHTLTFRDAKLIKALVEKKANVDKKEA